MIAFITLIYVGFYFIVFNKLGLLKKTPANISVFAGVGVVLISAIVFTWFTVSPMAQDSRVFRYVLPIVPNVSGEVVELGIESMVPVRAGDMLFRIDPKPYEFAVRQLEATVEQQEAKLALATVNLDRATRLLETSAASQVDVDIWTAERDSARAAIASSKAQLDNARWQLEETVVKAPTDGYAPAVQLREGMRVSTLPVAATIAFISTVKTEIVASLSQSAIRRVQVGDEVEMIFASLPGQVFTGRVIELGKASSDAQATAQGTIYTISGQPVTNRWGVRVVLDDPDLAESLPQGLAGTMAIYTSEGQPFHIISRVALRINGWMNYLTSP